MAITQDAGRQYPLVASVAIAFGDLSSGVAADAIELPPGAVVLDAAVFVDTAFNSATSDALAVGDSGAAGRFISAADMQVAGEHVATAGRGYKYASGGVVQVTLTSVGGGISAGAARLILSYVIDGRANDVQA